MEYPGRLEEFTKEQMMDYLVQYPKGIKAEALQLQLVQCLSLQEILDMLKDSNPIIPKAILNARKKEFERESHSVMRQSMANTKNETKKQNNTNNDVKKEKPKVVVVDNGDKTMEVIGKIFLSILLVIGVFVVIYIVTVLFGIENQHWIYPFGFAVVIPLWKSIWN